MDNNASQEKKTSIMKSLAIAGFISIIILIAWLSIQLVGVLPGAFSSLASLAESVSEPQGTSVETKEITKLTVTSNTTLVNPGESVDVTWSKITVPGSYTFSYNCKEGVAVDILNVDGIKSIACDTNYNVGDINTLSLAIDSEKERYADLNYKISFLRTNETSPSATGEATLTVVNSAISSLAISDIETPTETTVETETVEEVTETEPVVETPVVTTPVKPTPVVTTPAKPTPTYEQEFIYTIPTSNPNGRTDLSTRFLNVGRITGNTFFPGAIKQNDNGAIQFEVKNLGTKTSSDWTYTVNLPNGETYTSNAQKPLKPNERAVLTIGFPTDNDSSHLFKVEIKESTDNYTLNNRFFETIKFVK
ncbi:hypothetical protein H6784_02225 [Candidatus Nomurabacteria bacterium]|nr:hypothetical protein [Candidatus Kaiserbacteria bacterium]MCB9814213.1 hypothetical protein [Candidatus Nomurabacteria bacterium]